REAMIEAAPARACDVRPQSVEDAVALFVGIEAIVEKLAQEAAALRSTEADGSLRLAMLLHISDVIADGGRAQTRHGRILCGIDHVVNAARLEARGVFDTSSTGLELPLIARYRSGG